MDQSSPSLRLAIAYFGIPRSLDHTISSIHENVLSAVPSRFAVKRFAAFTREVQIEHPETGEKTMLNPSDALRLGPDSLEELEPWGVEHQKIFEGVAPFGDAWQNDFYSTRNLIKQLFTLKSVTKHVVSQGYEICLFLRPDLKYLDSFEPIFSKMSARGSRPTCVLANWGAAGGVNDLFGLCIGKSAITAYGNRLDQAISYCKTQSKPLHSERLLRFSLIKHQIAIKSTRVRALRIRANGACADQDFRADWLRRLMGG